MRVSRTKVMVLATVAIWTTAYLAWTADWIAMSWPVTWQRLLGRLIMCFIGAALCAGMFQILARAGLQTLKARILSVPALTTAASGLYAVCNGFVFELVDPVTVEGGLAQGIRIAAGVCWVFFLWSAVFFASQMAIDAQEARLKLALATASDAKARYHALAAQVHPHFLFNALNTVSALILDGAYDSAERTTVALAALLRHSLQTDPSRGTLGQELYAVRQYLDIVQMRFDDRLAIEVDVPQDLMAVELPQLILQPLVENVISHGVSRTSQTVNLSISARVVGDQVHIRVHDDALPDSASVESHGAGIGHENIRQRLSLVFDDSASLTCGPVPGGYEALLVLPLRV